MIVATKGLLQVDRAYLDPIDLADPPEEGVSTVLLTAQRDDHENGPYQAVPDGAGRKWERVQWQGAPQVTAGRFVSGWYGNPGDGLYLLPDASGITWGTTAISVTRLS